MARISAAQCKLARAALGLGIRELAGAADVLPDTVERFERGEALPNRTIDVIQCTLEVAGVEFVPDDGVRLRQGAR